jgi:hypothetical protein
MLTLGEGLSVLKKYSGMAEEPGRSSELVTRVVFPRRLFCLIVDELGQETSNLAANALTDDFENSPDVSKFKLPSEELRGNLYEDGSKFLVLLAPGRDQSGDKRHTRPRLGCVTRISRQKQNCPSPRPHEPPHQSPC